MQTLDPYCDIVNSGIINGEPFVEYFSAMDGARWRMYGTCNGCGECELGKVQYNTPCIIFTGIEIGQPGATYNIELNTRLDDPCRPNIKENCPNCTLRGEIL